MFKSYFTLYLVYQCYHLLVSPKALGSNYWLIENTAKLTNRESRNMLSDYHVTDDIRLRVGSWNDPLYSANKLNLNTNTYFRLHMEVNAQNNETQVIPWKECEV